MNDLDMAIGILTVGGAIMGTLLVIWYAERKHRKPDYRDIVGSAIDIPHHNIDMAKVNLHLQTYQTLRCEAEPFYHKQRQRGLFVELERKHRHPASIKFAKSGSIPDQEYYTVTVLKQGPTTFRKEVWSEEFSSLDNALYAMSRMAKPIQQAPITPPTLPVVDPPVTDMQVIQGRIDVMEVALELVKQREYPNRGLTLADVALLVGRQDYLDLLKERDELMWQQDAKKETNT